MNPSLPKWLTYIETLHPKTIALGLERVRLVAEKLNLLTAHCPIITVAGTNGKGSCVAFLDAIAQAAGYQAGCYTSPHLLRFNERIRIASQPVDDAALLQAFEQVEAARAGTTLTYFEFTTLAALWLFQQADLDLIVLEVGLGGRLDAVNIIDSDVAIITSIALDHMDWLGETREAIGYEKAGIFRAGRPAICGDFDPPDSVFQVARDVDAHLYLAGRDFHLPDEDTVSHLPLPSAACALMAMDCLKARLPVSPSAILQGLKAANLPARFQRTYYQHREVILDVAHNPAAAAYLAKRLAAEPARGKTCAVVSILADKDIPGTLQPLLPYVTDWFVAGLEAPRGANHEILVNHLQNLGVAAYHIHIAETVLTAFQCALQACEHQDRIVVFGSFHTVAPVLAFLKITIA